MSTSYSAYSTDPTTTYNPHPHPHPRPSTSTTSPPLDPNKPTSLISSNGFFEAYVVANKKELEVIRQENQEREYDDLGERVIRSGMTTGYCVSEIGQTYTVHCICKPTTPRDSIHQSAVAPSGYGRPQLGQVTTFGDYEVRLLIDGKKVCNKRTRFREGSPYEDVYLTFDEIWIGERRKGELVFVKPEVNVEAPFVPNEISNQIGTIKLQIRRIFWTGKDGPGFRPYSSKYIGRDSKDEGAGSRPFNEQDKKVLVGAITRFKPTNRPGYSPYEQPANRGHLQERFEVHPEDDGSNRFYHELIFKYGTKAVLQAKGFVPMDGKEKEWEVVTVRAPQIDLIDFDDNIPEEEEPRLIDGIPLNKTSRANKSTWTSSAIDDNPATAESSTSIIHNSRNKDPSRSRFDSNAPTRGFLKPYPPMKPGEYIDVEAWADRNLIDFEGGEGSGSGSVSRAQSVVRGERARSMSERPGRLDLDKDGDVRMKNAVSDTWLPHTPASPTATIDTRLATYGGTGMTDTDRDTDSIYGNPASTRASRRGSPDTPMINARMPLRGAGRGDDAASTVGSTTTLPGLHAGSISSTRGENLSSGVEDPPEDDWVGPISRTPVERK